MTVDVEDYYHVQAFAGVVRQSEWDLYPSRVERNTLRLLEIFCPTPNSRHFFRSRLGCGKVPRAG